MNEQQACALRLTCVRLAAVARTRGEAHSVHIDSGAGQMPLYTFRVLTAAGEAEMDLGFHRDEAAIVYAERIGREAAKIEIWRASEHLQTVGPLLELADARG